MTITAAPWCDRAAATLAPAVRSVENIAAQVKTERAALFWVHADGAELGAFVLRVDTPPSGAEGVVVAAAGELRGVDLTAFLLPTIEAMFKGCKRVRVHTRRQGMAAKLARLGFGIQEAVYTKELHHEPA